MLIYIGHKHNILNYHMIELVYMIILTIIYKIIGNKHI